jgi:hypothetical protein
MTLPPMPRQRVLDTHLPTNTAMYGYSAEDMRAYAAAAVAAEAERCAALCKGLREVAEHSSNGQRRVAAMAMAASCEALIRRNAITPPATPAPARPAASSADPRRTAD